MKWTTRVAIVGATVLTLGTPGSAQPAPADYQPHRAVYDVTLAESRGSGRDRNRVESARGRLVYEFTGSACEGWSTNMRFVTELRLGESRAHVSDIRVNSHESGQGDALRFLTRSVVNNQTRDEADGTATRAGEGLRVELRTPAGRTADLAGAILFPTQHMGAVLAAARRGERILAVDIFDGSEGGEKVYGTTAVLGRPIPAPPAGHPTDVEALRATPRWPVTISFFDRSRSGGEQTPLYELSIELLETGITHGIRLDYGEFALRGTMTALELLPRRPCG